MRGSDVVELIRDKFGRTGNPAQVPLLKAGKSFEAKLSDNGIYVDNLGSQPFLPWEVFTEAVALLIHKGGRALRGDAMGARLGEDRLSLASVEGHIAHKIYGATNGDSVFRRISPVAAVLIWAGMCEHAPGELLLREVRN